MAKKQTEARPYWLNSPWPDPSWSRSLWQRWAAFQICAWLPANRKDADAILKMVPEYLDKTGVRTRRVATPKKGK